MTIYNTTIDRFKAFTKYLIILIETITKQKYIKCTCTVHLQVLHV